MKFGSTQHAMISKIANDTANQYGIDEGECFQEALNLFTEQQARIDADAALPENDRDPDGFKPALYYARHGMEHFVHRKIQKLHETVTGWHMVMGCLERMYVGIPAFNPIAPSHVLADEIVLIGDDGQGIPLPDALRTLGAMMTRRPGMDLGSMDVPECMLEAVGRTSGDSDRVIFEAVWAELFAAASSGLSDGLAAVERIAKGNDYTSDLAHMHSARPVLH